MGTYYINHRLHFALVLMFLSQKGEFQYNFLRLDLQPALMLTTILPKQKTILSKVQNYDSFETNRFLVHSFILLIEAHSMCLSTF